MDQGHEVAVESSPEGSGDSTPIDGREAFRAALIATLDHAAQQGARRIWLCDPDFAAWPLGQPDCVDAFSRWVTGAERLTVIAASFSHVAVHCPRWVAWRRRWSHKVDCRQLREGEPMVLPSMLYAPPLVALRMLDLARYTRGRLLRGEADLAACGELIDAVLHRSEEGFPLTTIGL